MRRVGRSLADYTLMSAVRADNTFSFADLASAVWMQRLRVAAIVIATLALGAAYVFTVGARYRGEAFLRISTLTLPEFKKYSTPFGDGDRFVAWLQGHGEFTASEFDTIARRVLRGENPTSWASPRFALTKSDVRDLTEIPKDPGALLGVDIATDSADANTAIRMAKAVAIYVRDVLIEGRAGDLTLIRLGDLEQQLGELRVGIASASNDLGALQHKRDNLEKLRPRFPDSGRLDARQVVSLDNNGERFLPLSVQLLGVESEIVSSREKLERNRNRLEKAEFMRDYFVRARGLIGPVRTAPEIIDGLVRTRADVLQNRDAASNGIREGLAEIDADITDMQLLVNQAIKLDTEPHRAIAWERYRREILLLAFLMIGILLGVLYALVSKWRRRSRAPAVAGK